MPAPTVLGLHMGTQSTAGARPVSRPAGLATEGTEEDTMTQADGYFTHVLFCFFLIFLEKSNEVLRIFSLWSASYSQGPDKGSGHNYL